MNIVWDFVSSRLLAEIIVLIALPFLNGYAFYRVLLAVYRAGKPIELAMSGFGGAIWLVGYMVHGLEAHIGATELDYTFWVLGMALMLAPKLIGMWREHARGLP